MIKRIFLTLILLGMAYPCFSIDRGDPRRPDRWGIDTRDLTGTNTPVYRIDWYGNVLPGINEGFSIGEASHNVKGIYTAQIDVSSGMVNVVETFDNLFEGASMYVTPEGIIIDTQTLKNAATNVYATDYSIPIRQPEVPRTLTIISSFTSPTMRSTHTLQAGCTVYGWDAQYNYKSEKINFSNTSAGNGNIAWAKIDKFTCYCTSVSAFGPVEAPVTHRIQIGTSDYFGLANRVENSSDVYKVSTASSSLPANVYLDTTKYTFSNTYDTMVFGQPLSVGRIWKVWYRIRKSIR